MFYIFLKLMIDEGFVLCLAWQTWEENWGMTNENIMKYWHAPDFVVNNRR